MKIHTYKGEPIEIPEFQSYDDAVMWLEAQDSIVLLRIIAILEGHSVSMELYCDASGSAATKGGLPIWPITNANIVKYLSTRLVEDKSPRYIFK